MQQPSPEPLAPQVATRLTEFARACKAATRAVSLYPDGHPAVTASLSRLVDVAAQALHGGPLTVSVLPGSLQVDRRAPARPDPSLGELADLLHAHLVGELRIVSAADPAAWLTFLRLLAQAPGDLQARGGITRVWTESGGQHVQVREVDYAEVLREREAGIAARWDSIIEHCLQGDAIDLDEETLRVLLEIAEDAERFADLAAQISERSSSSGPRVQTEALLKLLRQVAAALARDEGERIDGIVANLSAAAGRLSPEIMFELMAHRYEAGAEGINVVDAMLSRITDASAGQFVAKAILDERGATERLAQVFQALVPDKERRQHVLALAREEVGTTPLGSEASFPELWQRASDMLTSYRDESFVPEDYALELSSARGHAADVERIADDPPERIAEWLRTVSDAAVRECDLQLLLDLLRVERKPDRYRELLEPVVAHVEDLVLLGDFEAAVPLVRTLTDQMAEAEGGVALGPLAAAAVDRLLRGHLMAHLVGHLRTLDDEAASHARDLVYALGPATIRPLAEALSAEQRGRAFRRLTDLLVGFGKAGRDAAEQLKSSPNPAVRRTAIYLLREFGGNDALAELTLLLDDDDPNVQREAVRAIAIIGTDEAYAALQRALASGTERQRDAIIATLGSLRDERAVPLFCHMVRNDGYRRTMRAAWLAAVEGLALAGGSDAVDVLREALARGEWWAPVRTAALRKAVAAALRRIGTPDAIQALEAAAASGPRSVRAAAREQLTRPRPAAGEPRA